MDKTIHIKYRPDPKEEFLINIKLFFDQKFLWIIILAIVLLPLLIIFQAGNTFSVDANAPLWLGVLLISILLFPIAFIFAFSILLLSTLVQVIRTLIRIWLNRKRSTYEKDVEYFFDEKGITSHAWGITSKFPWKIVVKVWQTKKVYFFKLLTLSTVIYIPKRAFDNKEKLNEFKDLIKEKGFLKK